MSIPLYIRNCWYHMLHRCYNPKDSSYPHYGARGIKVCDKWINDCKAFYHDIGDRPSLGHSLDRVDNNGNYEPGNVRWATQREQMQNRRVNSVITFNGETKCATQWAREIGISLPALRARLRANAPSVALTTPPRTSGQHGHLTMCVTPRGPHGKSSRFRGVAKQGTGWQASLKRDGVWLFRKYFKSELAAALAVDDAAWEAYGERALLNFPERHRLTPPA